MTKLEKYNEKRDFNITDEPEGKAVKSKGNKNKGLRFAVQLHAASRLHYDFRLEWEGVLLSWAVPKGPSFDPKDKRLAVRVEDHPLEYRSFEGTIPEGEYGGGTVMLWDEGTWKPLGDFGKEMEAGALKFSLNGKRLKGNWTLIKMKPKSGEKDNNWLLIKEKDEFTQVGSGIEDFNTSIKSHRTMAEISEDKEYDENEENEKPSKISSGTDFARGGALPFDKIEVMLSKLKDKPPAGDGWIHEIKFDGYRMVTYLEDGKVRMISRNGLDWSDKFPSIVSAFKDWSPGNMILDGEVVSFDEDGVSDFQRLQSSFKKKDDSSLKYIVFDLLAMGSKDLRGRPIEDRKEILYGILDGSPPNILYSFHQKGAGQTAFKDNCKKGLEGIISKKVGSKYVPGRSDSWLKIKCGNRQEFIIGGYTTTEKSSTGLSSLLLGVFDEKNIKYTGRAGTGFSEDEAKDILKKAKSLIRKTSPFTEEPEKRKGETVTYLEPTLIAEVNFAELTNEGLLRHASFKGLREDKSSEEVVIEKVGTGDKKSKGSDDIKIKKDPKTSSATLSKEKSAAPKSGASKKPTKDSESSDVKELAYGEILLSSPDKIVYPDSLITKKDVADYYWSIKDLILPHIKDRPMTLIRCTDGIEGECFYQKNMNQKIPSMDTVKLEDNDGDEMEVMVIRDESSLMGAVQMGTIEFHGWGSSVDDPEKPDMLVFDLDPDEGMNIDAVRQGVRDIRSITDELGLVSFLKTSGGKGYHLVIPVNPSAKWEAVRDFAKNLAMTMEEKWPDKYTSNMRKEKRKDRIFIDWIRNGRGATSVASFSLRARKNAPISWPLRWSDLDKVKPGDVTLKNHKTYKKTLTGWKDFFRTKQGLK